MEKQRKAARGWRDQLLTLVNGWDPAHLLDDRAARNEYDPILDELLGLLSRNAGEVEIAQFLDGEISRRFGVKPDSVPQFVTKAVNWFRLTSTEE